MRRTWLFFAILAVALIVPAFRPVCVPLSAEDLRGFNVPIEQRTDRDFYLRGLPVSAPPVVPVQDLVIAAAVLLDVERPNMRMKLSWRGGRAKGNRSILIAAAAPRSLCAIR